MLSSERVFYGRKVRTLFIYIKILNTTIVEYNASIGNNHSIIFLTHILSLFYIHNGTIFFHAMGEISPYLHTDSKIVIGNLSSHFLLLNGERHDHG